VSAVQTTPGKVDDGTRREMERVFALQQEYRWTAKNTTAGHRKAMLQRFKESVIRHADDARDALNADLGKPAEQPVMLEVATLLGEIEQALQHLDEWMQPVELEPAGPLTAPGSKVEIMYEGRGVCLVFGPWNFPYQLALTPLVPIIAAGNTAIVKPSEMAPAASALVATVIRDCFEEHEVAVFEGGVDVAEALLELPVDHVFFTGSPKVASIVMAAAAKHLASVTLELGGKCPVIVDETTDLPLAAAQVAFAKHYNSGQICLAPDHVWVKEELRDQFVDAYLEWIRNHLYTEDGQHNRLAMAHMIDERNVERVGRYVEDAKNRGAKVVGPAATHPEDLVIEPTVLVDVPPDADVMRDEIFGPVLPVLTYQEVDDILRVVNAGGKPLAMYIFSQDDEFVATVLSRTSSGGVTVNGWAIHHEEPTLPFGGVGTSGQGRYHGIHGFKELSHERAVVKQPEIIDLYSMLAAAAAAAQDEAAAAQAIDAQNA
jgi:aldehyde dehydrogenase (NAD+)